MLITAGNSVQGMLRRASLSNMAVKHLAKSAHFLLWEYIYPYSFLLISTWYIVLSSPWLASTLLCMRSLVHDSCSQNCTQHLVVAVLVGLLTNTLSSQIVGQHWKARGEVEEWKWSACSSAPLWSVAQCTCPFWKVRCICAASVLRQKGEGGCCIGQKCAFGQRSSKLLPWNQSPRLLRAVEGFLLALLGLCSKHSQCTESTRRNNWASYMNPTCVFQLVCYQCIDTAILA